MSLAVFDFESQYLHMNTKVGVILPDLPQEMEPEDFYITSGVKYKFYGCCMGLTEIIPIGSGKAKSNCMPANIS